MDLAPGEGFHGDIQVVGAGAGHFQHGGGGEAGAGVSMVLDLDVRIFLLDVVHELAEDVRTADAGHVLEADLIGPVAHDLVHDVHVVGDGMDGGVGDGEGDLGDHPAFLGAQDGTLEVAVVVEAAEGTGDVGALDLLDLEHELADVVRDGVHAQGVEAALEHVRLDAGLVEGGRPGPDRLVRVLAEQEVHLLEGAAVGLHAVEAAHVDDGRGHFHELVHPGNILAGTLPHIPVHQGELDFSLCHICVFVNLQS